MPNSSASQLARRLAQAAPQGRVLSAPSQLATYESDALAFKRFRPDAVVIPGDVTELAEVVRLLRDENVPYVIRKAFRAAGVEKAVSNSAGCGLALGKALQGEPAVQDVLGFLGEIGVRSRPRREGRQKVFVDLPCHLIHGQKVAGIPKNVLDATGYDWELAPCATDCCGSGGVYNIQKPENAREILKGKSAFLDNLPADREPILATANHVCMMQWNSARAFVKRPFQVRHIIQLLDPLN